MTQTKEKIAFTSNLVVPDTTYDPRDYYNPNIEVVGGRDKTLGHDVVRLHNEITTMELGEETDGLDEARNLYHHAIDDLRDHLGNLTAFEKLHFNTVFTRNPIQSQWLMDRLAISKEDGHPHDYIEALTAIDADGRSVVHDDLLVNAMELYQANIAELQKRLEYQRTQTVADFMNVVQEGAADGWLPTTDLETMRAKLLQVDMRQDDGTNTHLSMQGQGVVQGYMYHRRAYGRHVVVVSPEHLGAAGDAREMTLFHEFTHVVSHNKGAGLSGIMAYPDFAGTALNEAVTQHVAQSLYLRSMIDKLPDSVQDTVATAADIQTINPDAKDLSDNDMSYPQERRLLDALCYAGKHPVDVRLFIDAYMDGDDAAGRLYVELLDAFPGVDIHARIRALKDPEELDQLIDDLVAHKYDEPQEVDGHVVQSRKLGGQALGRVRSRLHELSTNLTMR